MGKKENTKEKVHFFSRISSKVMLIIAFAGILTASMTMLMVLPASTERIMEMTRNSMTSMTHSYATGIQTSLSNRTSMSYDDYAEVLKDAKIDGLDTSYGYLVSGEGVMMYHPTKEKVGNNVENAVIKDVVSRIKKGEKVTPDFVTYEFKGAMKYASYEVLSDNSIVVMTVDEDDALNTSNMLWIRGAVVACLGIVASIIVGFLGIFVIIKPLMRLTDVIRETAQLDFSNDETVSVVAKRRDEIGVMGKAIWGMRNSLREMVVNIKNSSEKIFRGVAEVNDVSAKIREQCMDNSATTEELAAGMQETSATSGTITENIADMKVGAADISNLSRDGVVLSGEISERAISLRDASQEASDRALEMYHTIKEQAGKSVIAAESVKQINEMTSAIMQISSQTSLLALNASIEAARAGEAGRGFAVVATEISELANETSNSVESINRIVSQVNSSVDSMVHSMEDATKFLDEVVLKDYAQFKSVSDQYNEDAKIVKTSMENVENAVSDLTNAITLIVEAMTGIDATIDESTIGVTDIAEKTSLVVSETAENADLVEACMESVEELDRIAKKFTL